MLTRFITIQFQDPRHVDVEQKISGVLAQAKISIVLAEVHPTVVIFAFELHSDPDFGSEQKSSRDRGTVDVAALDSWAYACR